MCRSRCPEARRGSGGPSLTELLVTPFLQNPRDAMDSSFSTARTILRRMVRPPSHSLRLQWLTPKNLRLSSLALLRASPIRDKIITLLIAHPDDEAMFFSPTLLSLTSPPLKNVVRVLCLSSGDADGLGAIRKGELVASCRQLGLRRDSDVTVLEHASLPDSMTTTWPAGLIAELLGTHAGDADVILTFDGKGVSSHPNHISLLHGVREYIKGKEGGRPRLYTLTSVGLARKYISVLDAPMAFLQSRRGKEGDILLFVNTAEQTRVAQKP